MECPLLVGVIAMTRANGVMRPVVVAVLPDPVPKSSHITVAVVVDASIVDLTSSKAFIVVRVPTVRNVAVIMSVFATSSAARNAPTIVPLVAFVSARAITIIIAIAFAVPALAATAIAVVMGVGTRPPPPPKPAACVVVRVGGAIPVVQVRLVPTTSIPGDVLAMQPHLQVGNVGSGASSPDSVHSGVIVVVVSLVVVTATSTNSTFVVNTDCGVNWLDETARVVEGHEQSHGK